MEYWAIARYDLGLGDEDWLRMTPRQLIAIWRRRMNDVRSTEYLFSRLIAAVRNTGFVRPVTPFEETAFMIHPFPEREIEREPPGDALLRALEKLPPGAAIRTN